MPTTVVETVPVQQPIVYTKQTLPEGINPENFEWHVVTPERFDAFLESIDQNGDNYVFYAIEADSFKKLATTVSDLKRYIDQQQSIIVYYETILKQHNQGIDNGLDKSTD